MRHFEPTFSLRIALLAGFACCAIACSSDDDHGPPIGAPTGPVVINEGGGTGGGLSGPSPVNSGGDANAGGSFNSIGGFSGSFNDTGAGSTGFDSPGSAGSGNTPPFAASGSTSTFGGSSF